MRREFITYDMYGKRTPEDDFTVDASPPSAPPLWKRIARAVLRLFPRRWNLEYRLGLSRFRYVTKVTLQ